jgi:hypothetical protein
MSFSAIDTPSFSVKDVKQIPHKNEEIFKNLCFKIFIVVSVFLAAIVVIVGILSLMASKGLVTGMPSISKLSVIGEANSYVMLCGGIALFVFSILSWSVHLKKEKQQALMKI